MHANRRLFIPKLLVLILVFSFISPLPVNSVQAAAIKISNKILTLETGKTKILKMKGTSKKVKWTSSNKQVASVSAKGKITAKTVGTATITAAVSNKKYSCKVTVVKPENASLKNAPFNAIEANLEGYSFVMPSDWKKELLAATENSYQLAFIPPEAKLNSYIIVYIVYTREKAPSFLTLQENVSNILTPDTLTHNYVTTFNDTALLINNFTQEEFKATFGSIMKTHCTVDTELSFEQDIYDFYLDNYYIQIATYDYETLDLYKIAEYVINSVIAQ